MYSLDDSVGYIVNRTALRLKHSFLKTFKEKGVDVTPEQVAILVKLQENNGLYQSELADIVLKDKPNITRILDVLEKRGFVLRQNDRDDRRKSRIFLTDKGKELLIKMEPVFVEIREKIAKIITPEERETLKKILNKINDLIE